MSLPMVIIVKVTKHYVIDPLIFIDKIKEGPDESCQFA
jgi:hypothetical protein